MEILICIEDYVGYDLSLNNSNTYNFIKGNKYTLDSIGFRGILYFNIENRTYYSDKKYFILLDEYRNKSIEEILK